MSGRKLQKPESGPLPEPDFADFDAAPIDFGALEPLMRDERVRMILVIGPHRVFIFRLGSFLRSKIGFRDANEAHETLCAILGYEPAGPIVQTRLADGTYVRALLGESIVDHPTFLLQKASPGVLTIKDLVRFSTFTPEVAEFLRGCVIAPINIVISGGRSSGKISLLNVLSTFVPNDVVIVSIEEQHELAPRHESLIRFQTTPNTDQASLIQRALRFYPDRLMVTALQPGAALELLQALNTGINGSLFTMYSNSPRDTLGRLEMMCHIENPRLRARVIREQIAKGVDLIVHIERLLDGTRKVVKITEVQGMEGDIIRLEDIFEFVQTGIEAGKIFGRIRPTGVVPRLNSQILVSSGIYIPPSVYGLVPGRYRPSPVRHERPVLSTLRKLMVDPAITQIMINGPQTVFVRRGEHLERTAIPHATRQQMFEALNAIIRREGHTLDDHPGLHDVVLSDGTWINVVNGPDGPLVTIQKPIHTSSTPPVTIEGLLRDGVLSPEMGEFFWACVAGHVNILVSGGDSAGRAALLQALTGWLPHHERVVMVAQRPESLANHPHTVMLRTSPEMGAADLVRNSVHMGGERLVLDEVRGPEALAWLQAIHAGYDGALATLHAHDPADALARLEMMCLADTPHLPIGTVRQYIVTGVHVVAQVERLGGQSHRVMTVAEVVGVEADAIRLAELFVFESFGRPSKPQIGRFRATGCKPTFMKRLEHQGIFPPDDIFETHKGHNDAQ